MDYLVKRSELLCTVLASWVWAVPDLSPQRPSISKYLLSGCPFL